MDKKQTEAVLASPAFQSLVARRRTVSLALTALILVIYYGFILVLAFDKGLLAEKIGAHITLGIPVGIGVIFLSWLLTGIYVNWANGTYDAEVEKIKEGAGLAE